MGLLLSRTSCAPVRSTMCIIFWLRFSPISFNRCHPKNILDIKWFCWQEVDFGWCFYCQQNVLIQSRRNEGQTVLHIRSIQTNKSNILHINIRKKSTHYNSLSSSIVWTCKCSKSLLSSCMITKVTKFSGSYSTMQPLYIRESSETQMIITYPAFLLPKHNKFSCQEK